MPISVKISSDLGHFKQCETCVTCGDVWNQRQLCLRTWISAKADNADTQPEYQHSHDHHQHQQAKLLITEKVIDGYFYVSIDDNDDDYWYDES